VLQCVAVCRSLLQETHCDVSMYSHTHVCVLSKAALASTPSFSSVSLNKSACMIACACACVRVCVHACVRVHACVCGGGDGGNNVKH